MLGGGNEGPVLGGNNDEQSLRDAIYTDFKKIIVSLMHCWNDLPIFTTRDFNFTRSGIYPYSAEDDKAMNQNIERWAKVQQENNLNETRGTVSRDISTSTMATTAQQPASQTYTLGEYLNSRFNNVQRYIVDFLKPLADTNTQHLIEGVLSVWLDKKNLGSTGNIHASLEKLMQLSQSVKITHYQVVESVCNYIEKNRLKT